MVSKNIDRTLYRIGYRVIVIRKEADELHVSLIMQGGNDKLSLIIQGGNDKLLLIMQGGDDNNNK